MNDQGSPTILIKDPSNGDIVIKLVRPLDVIDISNGDTVRIKKDQVLDLARALLTFYKKLSSDEPS